MTETPLWRKIIAGLAAWCSAGWLFGVVKLFGENLARGSIPHPLPILLLAGLGVAAGWIALALWAGSARIGGIGLAAVALFYLLRNVSGGGGVSPTGALVISGLGLVGAALALRGRRALASAEEDCRQERSAADGATRSPDLEPEDS